MTTNFGVETTAREASSYGYYQVFAEDATNALSAEEHRHTCVYTFLRMGRIRSTDEVVVAISGKQG